MKTKVYICRHCNLTISSLKFPSDFLEEHLKLPPRISADGAKIGYEGTGKYNFFNLLLVYDRYCFVLFATTCVFLCFKTRTCHKLLCCEG